MDRPPQPQHEAQLLALDRTGTPADIVSAYQAAAEHLIAYRTGEKRCEYRKLLLCDGEPVEEPPTAA